MSESMSEDDWVTSPSDLKGSFGFSSIGSESELSDPFMMSARFSDESDLDSLTSLFSLSKDTCFSFLSSSMFSTSAGFSSTSAAGYSAGFS